MDNCCCMKDETRKITGVCESDVALWEDRMSERDSFVWR